jgi:hypothetical protein
MESDSDNDFIKETARCSTDFHGRPRFDDVMISGSQDISHQVGNDWSTLLFAKLLCLFTLSNKSSSKPISLCFVQWYDRVDPFVDDTGMRIVKKGGVGIIEPDTIVRCCHIIPRFQDGTITSRNDIITGEKKWKSYYINHYIDIDAFMIL